MAERSIHLNLAASGTTLRTVGVLKTSVTTLRLSGLERRTNPREFAVLPRSYMIHGSLPNKRRLVKPLAIIIDYDDDEVIVSESMYHMHASAATLPEAIDEFKRIFSGYFDILSAEEEDLAPRMKAQLQYLRSYIASL